MKAVYANPARYGGSVYALVTTTIASIIHNEPTVFPALQATGLTAAFLDSLARELIPSASAIASIPNALNAICLNKEAQAKIVEANILPPLFTIFTLPKYIKCLQKANNPLGNYFVDRITV